MKPFRRTALSLLGLTALTTLGLSAPFAHAADAFPGGSPIRILVGFPAGGTIDVVARELAEQMGQDLGVSVVVETVSGAGGQLAAQALKRAPADGHTLMLAPDHTVVVVPLTVANPGFDVGADFTPVGMVADYAGALAVSQASGIKNMAEWIAYVKAHPEAGGVGVAAPGSKPQFQLDAMAKQLGAALNAVPYRGSVPMVQDLAGGHITAGVTALGDFLEFHKAGKMRIIGMTGDTRSQLLPDIPTAREQGYAMQLNFWLGMFAPKNTPQAVVERLNQSMNKALATAKVRERMTAIVFEPKSGKPAELTERVAAEMKQWAPVISASGWVKN